MAVAALDGAGVVGFAAWADHAIWPPFGFEVVDRGLLCGELFEEFKGADVAFVVVADGVWVLGHVVLICLDLLW